MMSHNCCLAQALSWLDTNSQFAPLSCIRQGRSEVEYLVIKFNDECSTVSNTKNLKYSESLSVLYSTGSCLESCLFWVSFNDSKYVLVNRRYSNAMSNQHLNQNTTKLFHDPEIWDWDPDWSQNTSYQHAIKLNNESIDLVTSVPVTYFLWDKSKHYRAQKMDDCTQRLSILGFQKVNSIRWQCLWTGTT